jgi:hypothetical protein
MSWRQGRPDTARELVLCEDPLCADTSEKVNKFGKGVRVEFCRGIEEVGLQDEAGEWRQAEAREGKQAAPTCRSGCQYSLKLCSPGVKGFSG